MKLLLAVLSHHQEQYAANMAGAISKLTMQPDKVLILLDRPTGSEMAASRLAYSNLPNAEVKLCMMLPKYIGRPQMLYGEEYFCAGNVRNIAIQYMLSNGYDAVIFIDGDCPPSSDLITSHVKTLSRETPVVTVGRRLETKWGNFDQREKSPEFPINIFRATPYKVVEEPYFVDSGVVWTCNFGMNLPSVKYLREMNKTIYGRDEVFSSDFVGTWGGEDGFIGFECYYGGIDVIAVPRGGVHHMEHPRPERKYDHITFLDMLEERRQELLYLLALNGYDCAGHVYIPKETIIGDRSWQKSPR